MKIHELQDHLSEELRSFVPSDKWPSNRCIGIEVEVEGAGGLQSTRLWDCINDSSLRNNGKELVTKLPLAGLDLDKAIDELSTLLGSNHLTVSERCSVHIHLDVRDLTTTQVGNILATYVACEAALYNFGGKERYDNIYCPGVSSALEQMGTMRKAMSSSPSTFAHGCNDWCKYTGINLRSVTQRGSIEFRAHEGTLDVTRIAEWASILMKLVEYAKETSRSNIKRHASLGADKFIARIFGDHAYSLLHDGIYHELHKNNMINLMDLLDSTDPYTPERDESAGATGSAELDDIIAAINSVIAQRGE